MSDDSVFNLTHRLWYLQSLKRNGTDWPDVDTYINDEYFLLYTKWICNTFPDFDWFYNEINVGNPMFDAANFTEYAYITFLRGLFQISKMLKYRSFFELTVVEHLQNLWDYFDLKI